MDQLAESQDFLNLTSGYNAALTDSFLQTFRSNFLPQSWTALRWRL
jgi:hypothetical protein